MRGRSFEERGANTAGSLYFASFDLVRFTYGWQSPLKARQGVERDFGEGDTCVCPSGVYSAEREDRGQSTSGGKLQCAQQPAWGH
ncbi:hypothetical protein AGIG_G5237 [Arapaima gigas]